MTVDDLIRELQALSAAGHGDDPVEIDIDDDTISVEPGATHEVQTLYRPTDDTFAHHSRVTLPYLPA